HWLEPFGLKAESLRALTRPSRQPQQGPSVCRLDFFHSLLTSLLCCRHQSPFRPSKIRGIVTNYLRVRTSRVWECGSQGPRTANKKSATVKPGRSAKLLFGALVLYAGTVAVSGPAAPPLTSPTLKRTKRRMEMFSPSLAMAC